MVVCFYYAVTTARKLVPTVQWTVGGEGLTEPNINFCEAKMQTSLVTTSVQTSYPSPRRKRRVSSIPLHLLFQTKPTSLGFCLVPFHANFISLAPTQASGLVHFVAPPLPNKTHFIGLLFGSFLRKLRIPRPDAGNMTMAEKLFFLQNGLNLLQ